MENLTIGKLARQAGVGVETVRYYQRRKLIATPTRVDGTVRYYSTDHVARLRFIKRAQQLGFSLDEIAALLKLNDGSNRKSIRKIAEKRLHDIQRKIEDLSAIAHSLEKLIHNCEHVNDVQACPIIEAFSE